MSGYKASNQSGDGAGLALQAHVERSQQLPPGESNAHQHQSDRQQQLGADDDGGEAACEREAFHSRELFICSLSMRVFSFQFHLESALETRTYLLASPARSAYPCPRMV